MIYVYFIIIFFPCESAPRQHCYNKSQMVNVLLQVCLELLMDVFLHSIFYTRYSRGKESRKGKGFNIYSLDV